MGDGRYYTTNQFICVSFLTIMLMVMVASMVLIYYKRSGDKDSRIALFSYGLLILSAFFSMHAEVVSNLSMMPYLILGAVLIMILSMSLFMIFLYQQRHKFESKQLHRYYFQMSCLLICHGFGLIQPFYGMRVIHYLTYVLLCMLYNKGVKNTLFFRVSDSIFRHVNNRILDYVFISDIHNQVVYKNKQLLASPYFKHFDYFDEKDMDHVFTQPVEMRHAYDKTFIQYKSNPATYFQFTQKQLVNEEMVVGMITTLTDISSLIEMLDHLNDKQEETRLANQKLIKHKEMVYDIEEEKEISKLLSEIAENQYESMGQLKREIDLLETVNHEAYLKELVKLIELGKLNLRDVRQAVSTYRDYYEGRRE